MELTIIGPKGSRLVEVVWVEALTPEGSFIIQKNHAPTTLLLSPGRECVYRCKTGKQEIEHLKHGGILHVTATEVCLIIG
jgi:F0F1-type ATP synthase epsilon subunit